jgi:hypothetical protein
LKSNRELTQLRVLIGLQLEELCALLSGNSNGPMIMLLSRRSIAGGIQGEPADHPTNLLALNRPLLQQPSMGAIHSGSRE